MIPFAIFVQSVSVHQLKAFERWKNLNNGNTDHSAPSRAICERSQACILGNLNCKIQIPLYRNVKLQPLVKN